MSPAPQLPLGAGWRARCALLRAGQRRALPLAGQHIGQHTGQLHALPLAGQHTAQLYALPPPGQRRALLRAALAGALAALLAAAPAAPVAAAGAGAALPPGGAGAALERSIKAAFLYKFLGYAEFPASAFADSAAPVAIGVSGADALAAELSRIVAGRAVQGRPIVVRTFRDNETPAGVHLLFIGGDDTARLRSVLKAVGGGPMLVVTESEQGLQQGSVINFKIIEERVRFDVSLEAADRNSVKLSSRLLTVANHVHKGAP